ncbi:MAG: hypothetical protein KF894_07295 [Labilithrix sp.]|nr:hypothetical protein [Labilithrix sp.]
MRSTNMLRAFAPLLACAVTVGSGVASAAPKSKGHVVLVGSSSVNDAFGDVVVDALEREGYDVVRRGYPSAGLSRPDFRNMATELSSMRIGPSTDAVMLYLGGNDAQALWLEEKERSKGGDAWIKWEEKGWSDVYERRVRQLVDGICARGARRVVVLPPADVVSAKMQRRLDRVRSLQQRAASTSKCGRAVATTGDEGALAADGTRLRGPGGVHMTHTGANRVWDRVSGRVLGFIAKPE